MKKQCPVCNVVKPLYEYNRDRTRSDGREFKCRSCAKAQRDAHRQTEKGKDARLRQNANRRRRGAQWMDDYRRNHPCIICGETEIVCLDFHHIDPGEKSKAVSRMVFDAWSLGKVEAEVAKCVILCANCHRKVHAGILEIPSRHGPESHTHTTQSVTQ